MITTVSHDSVKMEMVLNTRVSFADLQHETKYKLIQMAVDQISTRMADEFMAKYKDQTMRILLRNPGLLISCLQKIAGKTISIFNSSPSSK